MNLTRDRVRSIGWALVLTVCLALTAALTLRVNAVKGKVHQAEQRIIGVKRDIAFLETEFQTRASQQQLKLLNDVEFGYAAPRAEQYIEGERQLAALGKPRGPGAPKPIRMASAVEDSGPSSFMQLVSPLTGNRAASDATAAPAGAPRLETGAAAGKGDVKDVIGSAIKAADLDERLARIELPGTGKE